MRAQIAAALRDAQADGLLRRPLKDLTADQIVDQVLDRVLAALAVVPAGTPAPSVGVLPTATPVLMISPADVVAAIAATAASSADRDRETMVARVIPVRDGSAQHKHLAWKIARLFGVNASVNRTGWQAAGRPADLAGWQSSLNVLLDAGQAEVGRLPADDAATFWSTLGEIIVGTDRAKARKAAAKDRTAAARALRDAEFGPGNPVQYAPVAADGTPVAAAARNALATALV